MTGKLLEDIFNYGPNRKFMIDRLLEVEEDRVNEWEVRVQYNDHDHAIFVEPWPVSSYGTIGLYQHYYNLGEKFSLSEPDLEKKVADAFAKWNSWCTAKNLKRVPPSHIDTIIKKYQSKGMCGVNLANHKRIQLLLEDWIGCFNELTFILMSNGGTGGNNPAANPLMDRDEHRMREIEIELGRSHDEIFDYFHQRGV